MGGGGDTAKTLDEIQADLRAQLEANARQKLRDLGGSPGGGDDLKKTVPEIARRQFQKTYSYEYTGNPIDTGNPQVIGRRAPELCDVVPPASSQVTWYLNTQVFSQIVIPDWIKQKAVNDLYNHTRGIVTSGGTSNQWVNSSYSKAYDMTENVNGRSVKCNSTLVYIYGNLLEDGIRAEIAFICFCGVYYSTDSPTVQARQAIDADAYKTAPPLPGVNPPRQPKNQDELETSLDAVAKTDFQSHFGYPFAQGPPFPPDSYRAKGVNSALLTLNSTLHAIPDPRPGDDLTYYIERLYTGLNIPTTMKSVQEQAKENTATQYDTIIKTSQAGDRSWIKDRLDKNYDIPNVGVNRVRQTGVLQCWYGHDMVGGTAISMLYIHIMTMVYELEDPFETQTRELFGILGNQLRKDKEPGSQDIPFLQLEQWITDYSVEKFQERFGFGYQGSQSVVPDKKPGPVLSFSSLFRLQTYPATDDEVRNWIWDSVLGKEYPVYKRDEIIESIRRDVVAYANDDKVGLNLWYTGGTPTNGRIFPDDDYKGRDIQLRTYYLYSHGNPQATERILVFALGVITSWADPWQRTPASAPISGYGAAGNLSARSARSPGEYDRIPLQRVSA
ncbi:hypothetical protein P691DRAFT_811109 [Macrolepiota fuliginosa MF-IS2]|uniref:Uncharacterized protein n=1 Tax=Macrolepiota fuliginosa MF-IS2 TaxID=1400762 RepID=A0A9P6BWT3_9AGAR|nr:hypothetical protein P691DRAFT_811109 [Macrolepiota fuliginosa MF-IS2]